MLRVLLVSAAPEPGDVVRLDGAYTGAKAGDRAVIDGTHFGIDFEDGRGPLVLAVLRPSAFRQGGVVSVSGGPCPFIPLSALVHVGTTQQHFWRWKDRPRADGGEDYVQAVSLWAWSPSEDS